MSVEWKPRFTARNIGYKMASFQIVVHVHRPACEWLAEHTDMTVSGAARWIRESAGSFPALSDARQCSGVVLVVDDGEPDVIDGDDFSDDEYPLYFDGQVVTATSAGITRK